MSDAKKKADNQRRRMCLDQEITHIRAPWWFGRTLDDPDEPPVTVLGTAAQLHGTVCTCCPRRTA